MTAAETPPDARRRKLIVYLPLALFLGLALLFLTLHLAAMRNEIMRRRLRTMLMMQADARA